MAGDWIPLRHDIFEDPAVICMAGRLDTDEDSIVGKLARVWGWFDRQSVDGRASVSPAWIDRLSGCIGFSAAMVEVGWLVIGSDEQNLELPHFDHWISSSAKKRMEATRRKQNERLRKDVTASTDNVTNFCDQNATTEQDRTEHCSVSESESDGDRALRPRRPAKKQRPTVFTKDFTVEVLKDQAVFRRWFNAQANPADPEIVPVFLSEEWERADELRKKALKVGKDPVAYFIRGAANG